MGKGIYFICMLSVLVPMPMEAYVSLRLLVYAFVTLCNQIYIPVYAYSSQ